MCVCVYTCIYTHTRAHTYIYTYCLYSLDLFVQFSTIFGPSQEPSRDTPRKRRVQCFILLYIRCVYLLFRNVLIFLAFEKNLYSFSWESASDGLQFATELRPQFPIRAPRLVRETFEDSPMLVYEDIDKHNCPVSSNVSPPFPVLFYGQRAVPNSCARRVSQIVWYGPYTIRSQLYRKNEINSCNTSDKTPAHYKNVINEANHRRSLPHTTLLFYSRYITLENTYIVPPYILFNPRQYKQRLWRAFQWVFETPRKTVSHIYILYDYKIKHK